MSSTPVHTDAPRLPFAQPDLLRLTPDLRRLQEEGPLHRVRTGTGDPAWLVVDHATVRTLLADQRLGRSHPEPERAARTADHVLFGGPQGDHVTEPDEHRWMRDTLRPCFSPRRMRALEGWIDAITVSCLDDLEKAGPPADLRRHVAAVVPTRAIAELLGVPAEEHAEFVALAEAAVDPARAAEGMAELLGYIHRLVARSGPEPGEDVVSALRGEGSNTDEAVVRLAMVLFFAGEETTKVAMTTGVAQLMAHRDQWERLRADPGRIPDAVEEIVRTMGRGGGGLVRYARSDIEVAGHVIGAGDLVLLDVGAANHDPRVFDAPDGFDVAHPAGQHLAFGHGARYCVGAPLARMELRVLLTRLLERFPGLRLAVDPGELEAAPDVMNGTLSGGVAALPVTW
ncbi:cytochrome P450 [Nocardiopsis lucentensis]|uniref:cytochrome P450 n=1 Tax=Nocardiopsis lucentensis TaxID=53441 RepID=UPI00034653AE|nr:cytochrome P450 [Nocardiopsis lucentensis]